MSRQTKQGGSSVWELWNSCPRDSAGHRAQEAIRLRAKLLPVLPQICARATWEWRAAQGDDPHSPEAAGGRIPDLDLLCFLLLGASAVKHFTYPTPKKVAVSYLPWVASSLVKEWQFWQNEKVK